MKKIKFIPFEEQSEKELNITQTRLLDLTAKRLKKSNERLVAIDKNVKFFFWIIIIGFILTLISLFMDVNINNW